MSIFTEGTFNDPVTQDDLEPTTGARVSATVSEAWNSMVGPSLYRWGELDEARKWGGMAFGEMSPDQARSWIDGQGLTGHLTVEDRQYNPLELSILARRKKAELERRSVLERAGGGFARGGERLLLSLGTSLADPLTVATAFVPVVNEATYGRLLAQAGRSALARAGVRAGVGAAEGTVGQALVEPIVYGAHQAEQADYTLYDSLANIAFGGVFGGGLHSVGGAVVDFRTGRRVALTSAAAGVLKAKYARLDAQQVAPIAQPRWESPFTTSWVDDAGRTVVSATRENTPAENVSMPHSQVDLTEFPDNTLRVTWADNGRNGPGLPKGEGHVTTLYKDGIRLAESTDRIFTSDSSVTLGAVRVWDRLEKDGYEIWRNPAAELKQPPDVVTARWMTPDDSPVFEVRGSPVAIDTHPQGQAAARAEKAAPQTREAALKEMVARDIDGERGNVDPLFELDPATRTKPLNETLDSLRRGEPPPAAAAVDDIIEATDEAAVTEHVATLQQALKDLEAELKLTNEDLPADLRADLEAVKEAEAEARDLAETARMLAACAMRKSA